VVVHRWNSEFGENGEDTRGFWTGLGLQRVKSYVQCGGIMREWGSPLEWSSRPPYMASRPRLPFEVGGSSSGPVTD
jgi:hypothetical protein